MKRYEAWLASIDGLTPRHYGLLEARYGSAQAVWESYDAPPSFLGAGAHRALCVARNADYLQRLEDVMGREGIGLLIRGEEGYPVRLRQVRDAPPYLFVQGSPDLTDERTLAIVGARNCSAYGLRMARRIGREMCQAGVTVVSGMARGVDSGGHRGAIDEKGRTIAVVGCGLDQVYPPENLLLRDEIIAYGGSIVSEYGPGIAPLGRHFPARNRIIAGLSDALLFIEGRRRSGASITVGHALDLDRTVFVLPCQADSPLAELPNVLLREGAVPAPCGEDILSDMNWAHAPGSRHAPAGRSRAFTAAESRLLRLLSGGPVSAEELLQSGSFSPAELNTLLTSLEILGIIRQLPGHRVERIEITEE